MISHIDDCTCMMYQLYIFMFYIKFSLLRMYIVFIIKTDKGKIYIIWIGRRLTTLIASE